MSARSGPRCGSSTSSGAGSTIFRQRRPAPGYGTRGWWVFNFYLHTLLYYVMLCCVIIYYIVRRIVHRFFSDRPFFSRVYTAACSEFNVSLYHSSSLIGSFCVSWESFLLALSTDVCFVELQLRVKSETVKKRKALLNCSSSLLDFSNTKVT